jgi:uncharacterized protein YqhQ
LKKNAEKNCPLNPRLGKVGGQAVMEGVMMRSPKQMATAVRRTDDQTIVVRTQPSTRIESCAVSLASACFTRVLFMALLYHVNPAMASQFSPIRSVF